MAMTQYENGQEVYRATARKAEGNLTALTLSEVTVKHKGSDSSGVIHIRAGAAKVEMGSDAVDLLAFSDKVKLTDQHGRTLEAEEAVCSYRDKTVSAPGVIKLSGPALNATAQNGVTGSLESLEFTLQGPVSGSFDPSQADTKQRLP